ncbi:MAG: DUF2764 domain-containing protein [Brevinematales bacterium]|nr:DUF2764 domain-containing protein [Brevinematales bacterium]
MQYYYLLSGLYDISLEAEKVGNTLEEVWALCAEEMTEKDFEGLRSLFLFQDIANAAHYGKEGFVYQYPAYYTREEFEENMKDSESFLPFLAEYWFAYQNERRIYPELLPEEELTVLLYEHLEDFSDPFVREYYEREAHLRNIKAGLVARRIHRPMERAMLPVGEFSDLMRRSSSPDFGVGGEFDFVEKVAQMYESGRLMEMELFFDEVRWKWLEERVMLEPFSAHEVYSYVLRLALVTRWLSLIAEEGKKKLQRLITSIESKIAFSHEFDIRQGRK